MAAVGEVDGSEDVQDFLERIKDMGDKKNKEDEERARKLEEQILQGRKEREARRAERARSLSPNKDSPLASATSSVKPASSVMENYRASPTPSLERGSPAPSETPLDARRNRDSRSMRNSVTPFAQGDLEPSKPSPPPSNTNTLSRSNTLSWQQRPTSRGSGSRPLSMLSQENKPQRSPRLQVEGQEQASQEISRADAARSLEGKDPSWFRQTADRGKGSAAYRKNADEVSNGANGNVRLPGMSSTPQRSRQEHNTQPKDTDKRSSGESATKSTFSTPQSATTTTQSSRSKSPLPLLPSQRLDPSQNERTTFTPGDSSPTRSLAMSPSQRSLSPERTERPSSPTKGLGGFVQSAMLKRSDSINKHARANSQAAPSLSRSNSVMNTHNENPEDNAKASNVGESDLFVKPALPTRTLSQRGDSSPSRDPAETSPPLTPSRTLDSKRWSPTKTTWLESAIQKSDSPRPKSIQQKPPMWLSELQKSKQEGTSTEENKSSSHKKVEIGGFMRSPPLVSASKSPGLAGFVSTPESRNPGLSRNNSSANKDEVAKTDAPSKIEPQASPAPPPASLSRTTSEPSKSAAGDRKITPSGPTTPTETTLRKVSTESKSKPATPPKKDFRANLKSREVPKDASQTQEAEFKNVFGKLKKTETKNYVAPDDLKNNITRGKAGLAVTGGPRPYKKRDEFKDSILKKKEEMKTGGSIRGKPTTAPKPAVSAVPEAIARQRGLATKDVPKDAESPVDDASTKPFIDPSPRASPAHSAEQTSPKSPPRKQNSVQAGLPKQTVPEKKTSAPGRLQVGGGGSSSNLADRFNPSLAGIIARGPSPMSTTAGPPARTASPGPVEEAKLPQEASRGKELTHATKSRARGPKRRLPDSSKKASDDVAITPEEPKLKTPPTTVRSEKPTSPRKPSTTTVSGLGIVGSTTSGDAVVDKPTSPRKATASPAKSSSSSWISVPSAADAVIQLNTPVKFPPQVQASVSSLNVPSTSPMPAPRTPPTIKPKRIVSETQTIEDNSPSKIGSAPSPAPSSTQTTFPKSPKSPPVPSDKSKALAKIASNESPKPQIKEPKANEKSPTRQSRPPPKLLANFFESTSGAKSKAAINTVALLTGSVVNEGKIKTLRKEIWELGSDGKRVPLASHQEHILFEDKMYLCKHVFGSSSGKRITEVYLWYGDQVSQSAIEDSQLFARNEAKDAGGKLLILSQGKEPANFFDALGGIVITRRTPATTYTLCGRRHMGQIAFDEVEHSTQSLCSGFPFIISAPDGNLYLWKGKGANADELGCARLIGMDLGVSGEIAEIDEGKETPSFFKALGSTAKSQSPLADYWSLKGTHEKYGTRLFVIDTEARPKSASSFTGLFTRRPSAPSNEDLSGQIREISPFCQADISKDGIFVLDAFFEIYVIVAPLSTYKFPSFALALDFAQEYGILAASEQDRPFIPQGHVVFLAAEGPTPRDMQFAFRKWDERKFAPFGKGKEGKKVVSLNEALEAVRSME